MRRRSSKQADRVPEVGLVANPRVGGRPEALGHRRALTAQPGQWVAVLPVSGAVVV
jgi:hypothetical protein